MPADKSARAADPPRLRETFAVAGRAALLVLFGAVSAGCAASPAVLAADARDFVRLGKELEAAKQAGELDESLVRDVSEAVATAEIETAKGSKGESLLRSFGSCANAVRSPLRDRLERDDALGAVAASVLVSARVIDAEDFADYAIDGDKRPGYLALGARGLTDPEHADLRRALFLAQDEQVRIAALKAALTAPQDADLDALMEAARMDPHAEARAAAARAIGRIGGRRGTLALKDLWVRADGRQREAIADAWAAAASFDLGGREQLRSAAEQGGEGSVAAALILARSFAANTEQEQVKQLAKELLLRTIEKGTREDRVLAILMSPTSPELLDALRAVKATDDAGVGLFVLGRLARDGKPDEQKASRDKLFELASKDEQERERALGELAALGDVRAKPLLIKGLADKNPFARAYAGRGLISLGEFAAAAPLLADKESDVRASTSCAVLAREE